MKKTYCYIRISTEKQMYDRQVNTLKQNNYTKENSIFIEEKINGERKNRPLFDKMIEEMKNGDTLVVESLSRLGRSLTNNNEIIEFLINKKQVNIIILKENFYLKADEEATTKFLLNIFNCFAQFEREQLSERTKYGLEASKEKGGMIGRPRAQKSSTENFIKTLSYMIDNHVGQTKASIMCGFPTDTFKDDLKKYYAKYNTKNYIELLEKVKGKIVK